jgi:hypothetical protein
MDETMRVTGGCLCVAIRFEGDAEPQFQVTCYCTDCRRTSGAGHAAMMGFTGGAIHVTPSAREFACKADSGNDIVRAFCPTCGSGIYSRNAGMPHLMFLRGSALDDPSLFAPQLAVWAAVPRPGMRCPHICWPLSKRRSAVNRGRG